MKNLFLILIYLFLLFILSLNFKKIENFNQKESLINYPIYWINLDRSPNRKIKLMEKFKEYNIENYRITAIDSKNLNLNNYNIKKNILTSILTSKNEIACTLSHLKAIKTSYLNNDKFSIICEDDLCLDLIPHWKISINEIINKLPENWEIINLAPSSKSFLSIALNELNLFKKWNTSHHGAICYLINKKGMRKIVNKFKLLDKIKYNDTSKFVADEVVYKYLNSYTVTKPFFTFIDEESTIHKSHEKFNNYGKKMILDFYNVNVC